MRVYISMFSTDLVKHNFQYPNYSKSEIGYSLIYPLQNTHAKLLGASSKPDPHTVTMSESATINSFFEESMVAQ